MNALNLLIFQVHEIVHQPDVLPSSSETMGFVDHFQHNYIVPVSLLTRFSK